MKRTTKYVAFDVHQATTVVDAPVIPCRTPWAVYHGGATSSPKMSIEDRLRQIVTALPEQASVTLPVLVVKGWLDMEADDPLADLTVADVAEQLGRSPGTVRDWIRRGEPEA